MPFKPFDNVFCWSVLEIVDFFIPPYGPVIVLVPAKDSGAVDRSLGISNFPIGYFIPFLLLRSPDRRRSSCFEILTESLALKGIVVGFCKN